MHQYGSTNRTEFSDSLDNGNIKGGCRQPRNGNIPKTCVSASNVDRNSGEKMRPKSISLPFISCSLKKYKRSASYCDLECNVNSEDLKGINSGSSINENSSEYSVKFSDVESTEESGMQGCFCGFSKRQVKCGVALLLLSFVDVMGFSIFAPFFPIVAEQKNLTPLHIGIIFAAFSMAGIFASILTGTLLVKVGAKYIILAGLFWSAGATICFGLLQMVAEEYFFTLCLLCRIMMGIGSSAAFTAIFAIIFKEFSERSLTMIGISESLCSIGGILGPLFGGALYDMGGFMLPFMFLGGTQLLVLILCFFTIPSVAVDRQINTVSPARLLLNVNGFYAALFVVISFTINSFIIANLSQFLTHSFGISAFMVGVYMLVFSVFYGAATPIWGYVAESRNCGAHMMALSGLIGGIVMAFFGPCDFLLHLFGWSAPKQWLVYVVTGLLGICMGAMVMPTFGEMLIAAKQMRLHTNVLAEYGLVSGLWNTVFAVGDILGPTLGGVLVEKIDFVNTCAVFGAALALAAVFKMIHLCMLACRRKSADSCDSSLEGSCSEERASLLGKHSSSAPA